MNVMDSTTAGNPTSQASQRKLRTPEQVADELQSLSGQLRKLVAESAGEGKSFDQTERKVWQMVRTIGFEAMELFVSLQGNGDLGARQHGRRPAVRSIGKTDHHDGAVDFR